jgi:serine/threonine-protein kinase
MVGYSSIAKLLEENINAASVAKLNQQIHTFIADSLEQIPGTETYRLIAKTGDGAIVLFQHAEDAHRFGFQVHLSAREHTGRRSESTAERWFRVGIATGEVNVTSAPNLPCEYAGIAIANAVRLEASAKAGEIVVDANTFAKLSTATQALYGSEEVARGKRDERFRARRCCVTKATQPSTVTLRLQRRPSKLTVGVLGLVIPLFCLLLIPAVGDRVRGMLFSSREKHIAVLPLDFVGEDPKAQALGDGLMDSLAGKLANLDPGNQSLFVVPASEVRRRKVVDPQSALREFGARIVVKCRFERNQQAARLELTVIDSSKDREIGYVEVDNQSGDLFALQDQAVTRLGRLMNIAVKENAQRDNEKSVAHAAYEDYLAGLVYFERDDQLANIDPAIASLQKAVQTDPNFALALARLAQVLTMKYLLTPCTECLQQAEPYATEALKLDNRLAPTYVALGQIHALTGKPDLAMQEFHNAINLDPWDADAIAGIARFYHKAGNNADAEAMYIRATSVRPDEWKGYEDLGNFYEEIGRPQDAILQYNHALQLTPENSWIYTNLGMTYMDFDDPKMLDKAEKALQKAIALDPKGACTALFNLGSLYTQLHRFQDSVAANQAALKLNDKSYPAWTNLTIAYEWLGEVQKAEFARRQAIELLEIQVRKDQQDAVAQATLSSLYAKAGKTAEAREKIRISRELTSTDSYVDTELADAYELLGERSEAVRSLQHALKLGLNLGQIDGYPDLQDVLRDLKRANATSR